MAKNCLYEEGENLPYVLPYDVTSGQGVLVGNVFGVAESNGKAGDSITLNLEGVWLLTKATGANTGGAFGTIAYWNNTTRAITAVSSGNTKVGSFFRTAADGDATAAVKLNGTV